MNDLDLETALERFGFSQKEVATYLVIIDHGEIRIRALAEDADVSVRYAYNVAERLEQRGLVVVDDYVTPTVVRAVSPSDSIPQLKAELSTIESALNARFVENQIEHHVEVLKSRSTLVKRMRENIQTAETELFLSIPAGAVAEIAGDLRAALDRGVFVLLLVTRDATTNWRTDAIASAVRTWEGNAPVLLTVDSRGGLFAPSDMFHHGKATKRGICLWDTQLVPIVLTAFLGNYWRWGSESSLSRPRELPFEYAEFRHAVFDATCLLRQGVDLHAEIKFRRAATADGFETVSGRVVETRQAMVEPLTSTLPIENSLFVSFDGDVHSIGGPGAFVEEYESKIVRLTALE